MTSKDVTSESQEFGENEDVSPTRGRSVSVGQRFFRVKKNFDFDLFDISPLVRLNKPTTIDLLLERKTVQLLDIVLLKDWKVRLCLGRQPGLLSQSVDRIKKCKFKFVRCCVMTENSFRTFSFYTLSL